jgi:hypothetical protein
LDDAKWLAALPTSCEDRLRQYVHAGIRPRIPLEEQNEQRPRLRALAFDPSLLAAVELRGLARGRCRCRSPFAQLELARIAFRLNRMLLNSFARELTGCLDRFSCPRECSSEAQGR